MTRPSPPTLFSWLRDWSRADREGVVQAIYIAPAAGAPMEPVETALAIVGHGLEGDRYAAGRGHWRATDGCQVTLVSRSDLVRAREASGLAFDNGEHRRNLVVEGVAMAALRNRDVRIGEARLRFHRLRPPCGYLERLHGAGTVKALRNRGGVGLTVVTGGRIRVGDAVTVLEGPADD